MIATTTLEKAIEYIGERRWVSMVELGEFLRRETGEDPSGTIGFEFQSAPNLILWVGSQALVDLFDALRRSGRVRLEVADPLVYLVDGGFLEMPLAKRPPAAGYKDPHWLPIVLDPA